MSEDQDLSAQVDPQVELSATDRAELRAMAAEFRALETNILLARSNFARMAGITFNGKRDEYEILGYPRSVTSTDYREEYERGGIAGRIVDVMPDATWRGEPAFEILESEDPKRETEFEKTWISLEKRLGISSKLRRVDKLSRLSTYAILLIGAPDGQFEQELPRAKSPKDLLYLTPFSGGGGPAVGNGHGSTTVIDGGDATIEEYDLDPKSERFGKPKTYRIRRIGDTATAAAFKTAVHWTRVHHIAEDLLDDDVFGQPALQRVWNLLIDLRKITGGGAEAYWLRANQGMHVDVDKDMKLPDAQNAIAALKEQAEAYQHQLTRWLRTRGVKAKVLGSDVADFSSPADAIITQIAGAKAIPKRILTGSEMGELASSQDRENFKDQVNGRQTQYAGPCILRPFIDRLIAYGYLPTPKGGTDAYIVKWPHVQVLTEDEKAKGAVQWAQTAVNGVPVFTGDEIRDKFYGMDPLTTEQMENMKELKEAATPEPPPMIPGVNPVTGKPVAGARGVPGLPGNTSEDDDEEDVKAAQEVLQVLQAAIEADNHEVISKIIGTTLTKATQ